MDMLEKKERVITLQDELRGIISNGEAEVRELNETETSRMAEIRSEIDTLNAEIEAEEKENRELINNKENKTENKMEVRLYNLIKKVALGETLTDEERQYVSGSKINYRTDIQAQSTDAAGKAAVPEDKKALEVAVRNASVLNRIGATWFNGATGDISIPRYSGSNVAWAGEIAEAADGAGEFDEVVLQPKRLTAYLNVSKTFLAQVSDDAEAILIRDLAEAIAEKFDMTVFSADSGTTTRPEGLFYNSGYTTTGGTMSAITYDDVLDLELAVEEKNGTNYMFIASPQVKFGLKGTQMASGLQMVWNGNEVDGYKAVVSNSVERKGIICMDPRDLVAAVWQNIDITVDPYTRAAYNEIRLVVNFLCDCKLKGDRIAAKVFDAE